MGGRGGSPLEVSVSLGAASKATSLHCSSLFPVQHPNWFLWKWFSCQHARLPAHPCGATEPRGWCFTLQRPARAWGSLPRVPKSHQRGERTDPAAETALGINASRASALLPSTLHQQPRPALSSQEGDLPALHAAQRKHKQNTHNCCFPHYCLPPGSPPPKDAQTHQWSAHRFLPQPRRRWVRFREQHKTPQQELGSPERQCLQGVLLL